ncbi:transglutaminase family protein [Salinarimonas rosea]|uniref:transglutaminase family protein n=1 Tax=Salinarimonas rosea TaxID=552063 RepID=UPI00041BE053|nr:transglutaminase family protein [Salinarimonas rosea]
MRIRIEHETTYSYEEPARGLIQVLRLTPRSHVGQHVVRWRIEPSLDGALRQGEDALGNVVHRFAAETAGEALTIRVTGIVETDETHGVVRGTVERAPDLYFLRTTPMTAPSDALAAFAAEVAGEAVRTDPLAALHALNTSLAERMTMERGPADAAIGAAGAFAAERGVAQDLAHAFVAGARHLGIPARNVSGYLHRGDDGETADGEETGGQPRGTQAPDARAQVARAQVALAQGARAEAARAEAARVQGGHVHAWAEALAPGLGWVAFDPSFGVCAGPRHVRVAIGLDAPGCAPVRGARYGGGAESLSVRLSVQDAASGAPAPTQSRSQSQS